MEQIDGLRDVMVSRRSGTLAVSGIIIDGPKAGRSIRYGVRCSDEQDGLTAIREWVADDRARLFCRA